MKGNFFLMFLLFSMAAFITATLLVLFFFKLFPEEVTSVYFLSGVMGLVFGALCYLPFRWFIGERKE
ncbi:MAG: hypothetical protein A2Y33_01285 [Spirochaetes bacterium GWF1_51_8]|nr:MAG: hypothetical protein A2Y33_01285 [Spirochaetes bacterium GWF1_51_8]